MLKVVKLIKGGSKHESESPGDAFTSPTPAVTKVPSLPLFVHEPSSKSGDVTSRSGSQTSDLGSSYPDCTRNSDSKRYRGKGRKKYEESYLRRKSNSGKEDVLVHTSHCRKRHHRNKSCIHVKIPNEESENNEHHGNNVKGEHSSLDHIGSYSQPETDHIKSPNHENGKTETELHEEIKRLKDINQHLNKKLQASVSSADSGCQHSTEEIIQKKEEEIANLKHNLKDLDRYHRDLERERDVLKDQLEEKCTKEGAKLQEADANFEKVKLLEDKNKQLTEDVTMLKDLVYRLNVELENYEEKFYKEKRDIKNWPPKIVSTETNTEGSDGELAWDKINRATLGPLLIAYSETIKEKNDLIQDYEKNNKTAIANCKSLVEENGKLYQELEEMKNKYEENETKWNITQQDSTITQEQNELLASQLEIQKDKMKEIHSTYQQRVETVTKDLEEVCGKYHTCRGDLLTIQGRYTVLREEYEKLQADMETKVPFSIHSASVTECRKLFEELKLKYEEEKKQLCSKIAELESEKSQLEVKLANAQCESQQLQTHSASVEKILRKTQVRCEALQGRLVNTQVSRDTTKRQLQKAMAFAEELVKEQENLLKQLHAKQEETKSIAKLGTTIVCRMGSLKHKLKNVQQGAWQELDVIEKRIKQQEAGVERMKDEYHKEVVRLRNLLKQKETIIGRLQKEKCKTEENLEVVWRAATSENIHIKESLKRINLHPDSDPAKFFIEAEHSSEFG